MNIDLPMNATFAKTSKMLARLRKPRSFFPHFK
jgi:hypothetical protein